MLSFSFLLTIVQYVAHVISFLYVLYISWLISRSLVVTVQPNECCQTENVLVYVTLVCSFYRQMKHYKTLILCPGCKYRTVSNMATRLCKWFNVDKACDDENELSELEEEYHNWVFTHIVSL